MDLKRHSKVLLPWTHWHVMEREKLVRITVPEDFLVRLQGWIDTRAHTPGGKRKIRVGKGNLGWNEITASQALDALLKEVGF